MPCARSFSKWPSAPPSDPLDQDCNCHANAMTCRNAVLKPTDFTDATDDATHHCCIELASQNIPAPDRIRLEQCLFNYFRVIGSRHAGLPRCKQS